MKNDYRLVWVLMGLAVLFAAAAFAWVARAIASDSNTAAPVKPAGSVNSPDHATSIYDIQVRDIDGKEVDLGRYRGKALLIVNTASKCGFTPQYAGLQKLYADYRDRGPGLEILAFPANNFLGQEPGTDGQIKEFCTLKYQTTFPIFSKISVKGSDIHPLYRYLTTGAGHNGEISWNFNKFVVSPEGRVTARFGSRQDPLSPEVLQAVETALTLDTSPNTRG